MENSNDVLSLLFTSDSAKREENNKFSKDDIDLELSRINLEHRRESLVGKKQDRRQRGIFSICIFSFVCIYVIAVLVIVILCGASVLILDTTVLVTILTTNTANVIGIFVIVAKYLFHTNDSGALPS